MLAANSDGFESLNIHHKVREIMVRLSADVGQPTDEPQVHNALA